MLILASAPASYSKGTTPALAFRHTNRYPRPDLA